MKKLLLAVLLSLALGTTAFAKPLYDIIVKLPDGAVQTLTNKMLNQDVTKITDGKITCYIVTTKNAVNIQSSASISCVK